MMIHMCMSVAGFLRNNPKGKKGMFTRDDGTTLTAKESRQWMLYQQSLGRKVIPMCECDNFDYETGCKGHKTEEDV